MITVTRPRIPDSGIPTLKDDFRSCSLFFRLGVEKLDKSFNLLGGNALAIQNRGAIVTRTIALEGIEVFVDKSIGKRHEH